VAVVSIGLYAKRLHLTPDIYHVQATSLNERNAFLVALQVLQHLLHCNFMLLLGK